MFNLVNRHYVRSVLKCALWVSKIHIVASDDNQIPMCLNTSHPKINIAAHADVFEE